MRHVMLMTGSFYSQIYGIVGAADANDNQYL